MKSTFGFPWSAMFAAAVAFSAVGTAFAQVPPSPFGGPAGGPVNPPSYSPYLNLLNRGQSPGANYYGLVRPQLGLQNAVFGLQQQLNGQQNAQQQLDQRGLPYTGHVAGFMNYRSYFLNMGTGFSQMPVGLQGQQLGQQLPKAPGQTTAGQGLPAPANPTGR